MKPQAWTKGLGLGIVIGALLVAVVGPVSTWLTGPPPSSDSTSSPDGHTHDEGTLYTCGMHPQVIRDEPGTCPICQMPLTPMTRPASVSTPGVVVDPAIRQSIGVRTAVVRRGPLGRTVRTVARVEPSERREVLVTTKYAGWIEKLFVSDTGQYVRRGQPLFTIFSPEVVAGQEQYLLSSRQSHSALADTSRDRLLFWGLTPPQVARIEKRRKPIRAVTVFSPASGYVVDKAAVEGAHVKPDRALFRIVDLGVVWVKADVYEYEVPWLKPEQPASLTLSYVPGQEFEGKVAYIYPFVQESSRTVQLRLEFDNPDLLLKPGMFGTVRIETTQHEDALRIPSQSILRTGERRIVFVDRGGGHFERREVVLGIEGDAGLVEIRSGLKEGERIAVSGNFLLDSESQLREAVEKMMPGGAPPATRPASHPASHPASRPSAAEDAP